MTETPIAELHRFGINFHKTNPLKKAGVRTVEHAARLVTEHGSRPEGSELSNITGMGPTRIAAVTEAVGRWKGAPDAPDQYVIDDGVGGFVCSICETPTESEPCREHQPHAWREINEG